MWRSWHSRYNWKLPEEKLKNSVNVRFFVRVLTSWSQVGTFISCSCSSMQSSKDSSLEKILNQSLGPQVIHTLIVGSKFIPLTKCLRLFAFIILFSSFDDQFFPFHRASVSILECLDTSLKSKYLGKYRTFLCLIEVGN